MTDCCEHQSMEVQNEMHKFDKFCDTKSNNAPADLTDLIAQLHQVFESDSVNIEYVQKLMGMYASKRKDWKKFAKFDPHRYTRNLVDEGNGKFNLMILCWNESQGSSIHSHANSHCFLKVIEGSVQEEMYDWPSDTDSECEMTPRAINQYKLNQVAYINDDIGLHRVENLSHCDKAVSLHLYSPPYDEAESFDPKTGNCHKAKVTFWSKYGKRTPYGRTGTDDSVVPEND